MAKPRKPKSDEELIQWQRLTIERLKTRLHAQRKELSRIYGVLGLEFGKRPPAPTERRSA